MAAPRTFTLPTLRETWATHRTDHPEALPGPADEALRHDRAAARAMRNECGIMECLETRQRATALLPWRLVPDRPEQARDQAIAAIVSRLIERIPRFLEYRRNLLEALWYGRYAVAQHFGPIRLDGRVYLGITRWEPRHGDKLVFRADLPGAEDDDRGVGLRVAATSPDTFIPHGPASSAELAPRSARHPSPQGHASTTRHGVAHAWPDGHLEEAPASRPGTFARTSAGVVYFLARAERDLLVVHQHLIEDGPADDLPGASAVAGLGIRSRIYWTWFAMQECLAYLLEYLERSALGLEIWSFPAGNPEAERATREAAERKRSGGRSVILVPKLPGESAAQFGVEHIEPGLKGAEVLQSIITDYFATKIKRYILGQTLTSEIGATGLGSGVADAHRDTFAAIVDYDAQNLAETLTRDLVEPLVRLNFPGDRDVRLRLAFETPLKRD